MKWTYKEPSFGDMIRVYVGTIYHFGIYVSDDEVIQFGLPPSRRAGISDAEVEVLKSDIDAFLAGGFLEVCEFDKKEKKKNRSPKETVDYARSKIGTRGYHILYNNCEHFANECISGVQICRQAEDVRALFRSMPIVDVYIAAIPENEPTGDIACKARREEISSVSNEKVRREKYFVWKLLCYALERSFGKREKKLDFVKKPCGAWSTDGIEFSLSHSDGAVAVAVSRAPVGIDIESVHSPRSEKIAERIMTEDEFSRYNELPAEKKVDRLIEIWTAKEAIFKSKHKSDFVPSQYSTLSESFKTDAISLNDKKYVWTTATETPEKIRIFTDIDLTKIN